MHRRQRFASAFCPPCLLVRVAASRKVAPPFTPTWGMRARYQWGTEPTWVKLLRHIALKFREKIVPSFFKIFIVMARRKWIFLTMLSNSTWKTTYIGLGFTLGGAWPPEIVCQWTVNGMSSSTEIDLWITFWTQNDGSQLLQYICAIWSGLLNAVVKVIHSFHMVKI